MTDTLARMGKAAITLPTVEYPHIYKEPPKQVHNRHWNPINVGEVLTNVGEEAATQDRLSGSISRYAYGIDPMVAVSYTNNKGAGLYVPQAHMPKKIMRDGSFVPPTRTLQDMLPWSRMKYGNYSADGRKQVGTGQMAFIDEGNDGNVGMNRMIRRETLGVEIEPIAWYPSSNMSVQDGQGAVPVEYYTHVPLEGEIPATKSIHNQLGKEDVWQGTALDDYSARYASKEQLVKSLGPNFQMVVRVPGPNGDMDYPIDIPLKEKLKIVGRVSKHAPFSLSLGEAGGNAEGQRVKLKNYKWEIIRAPATTQGGVGAPTLVLRDEEQVLSRVLPAHSSHARALPLFREGLVPLNDPRSGLLTAGARPRIDVNAGIVDPASYLPFSTFNNDQVTLKPTLDLSAFSAGNHATLPSIMLYGKPSRVR